MYQAQCNEEVTPSFVPFLRYETKAEPYRAASREKNSTNLLDKSQKIG